MTRAFTSYSSTAPSNAVLTANHRPAYKPGTTLYALILDGWARDLNAEQTHREAHAQGYRIDLLSIKTFFALHELVFSTALNPDHKG